MKQITHFLLWEGLFHQNAEEDDVSDLSEDVEQLSSGVWVHDDVVQLSMIIPQYTYEAIVSKFSM